MNAVISTITFLRKSNYCYILEHLLTTCFRHGARLDAADKQWHLTSPTPYDPPLTYGGWTQSRSLGARIASILRSREADEDIGDSANTTEHKRKHKVIIHTSPFLRCVQTGIAISAGLALNPGHTHKRSSSSNNIRSSPNMRPLITESPRLAPILEPGVATIKTNGNSQEPENIKRARLRVDAFLGEWLSPDYFELITPPPSSIMMVAGAKADLLRREDTNRLINIRDMATAASANPFVGFPGGWGSPMLNAVDDEKDEGPLSTMSSLAQALPRRDRTSSLSSVGSTRSGSSTIARGSHTEHGVYNPPIPSYAISNADAIPPGYVSHARDACVDVDYQWDSMRAPQNWGNGGEYGEEWSSMHKRFRRGLQNLINWYCDQDDAYKLVPRLPSNDVKEEFTEENDDDDSDLVVILVTHGAGCNALIGALTNQPVLLDVGMASLTMAVHKPSKTTPSSTPGSTPKVHSRAGSRTLSISDEYEVKLVANTEHLRSSSTSTPSTSRSSSMAGIATNRSRFVDSPPQGPHSRSISSVNFGSMRRAASVASTPLSQTYVPTRQISVGLWSAPKPAEEPEPEEPGDDMVLNFGGGGGDSTLQPEVEKEAPKVLSKEVLEDDDDDVPELGGGLWGKPKGLIDPGILRRDIAPKRRWTINERGTG